jgi:DNA primase
VSLIPDEVIEQVREAADLVGIIGEHVELKRTGADFRGPCPFHGGTHRNFAVIPKKGMFYCFVCHEAGDVFTFFMKRLGMDYPTAVREVARRVGITIPERGPSGPDPHEPLYGALATAADWFARQLVESPEADVARQYLASRQIELEAVLPMGLGYAPKGKAFLDAMQGLGLADDVVLAAGLAVRRDDGALGPRFRGRLLFPIHDVRGRVVGFGGRILDEGEPKYLNSPDTPIFHKGRLLYNLHAAKHALRKAERAILVEGYFDVLRLSLAGIEEVVAPLGTGLSAEQAQLVKRYAPYVILLYDSDEAGLRATFRAGDELLRERLRVSVATLPAGEDPDTLVSKQGAAGLEAVLKDAVDVFERKVQILDRKGFFGNLPGRRRALDRLLPTIRAAADPITRELYISRAGEVAGVRKDVLEREVTNLGGEGGERDGAARVGSWGGGGGGGGGGAGPTAAPGRVAQPAGAGAALPASAEKTFLLLMFEGEEWKRRVIDAVDPEEFEFLPYREVFEAIADDAVLALSETSARAYELLRGEGLGDRDPNTLYERAVNWIEARRLERQLEQIDRRIPFETPDGQAALIAEKRRVFDELRKRYPRYKIAMRRRGASGT